MAHHRKLPMLCAYVAKSMTKVQMDGLDLAHPNHEKSCSKFGKIQLRGLGWDSVTDMDKQMDWLMDGKTSCSCRGRGINILKSNLQQDIALSETRPNKRRNKMTKSYLCSSDLPQLFSVRAQLYLNIQSARENCDNITKCQNRKPQKLNP